MEPEPSDPPIALTSTGDPRALALYFPHAFKGQSILARVPPNSWIVVDANHPAGGRPNPTVQMLERGAQEDKFRLIAVVITHFHHDHYSGVADVLGFCERLAQQRGVRLADVLQTVVLPQSFEAFHRFLGGRASKPGRSYLGRLLQRLQNAREREVEVTTLTPLSLAWKETDSEALRPDESWVFTLFPAPVEVNQEFFAHKGYQIRSLAEVETALQKNANRYAYILSIGWGRDPQHFHFLLTSDVPGDAFQEMTAHLRDRVLSACRSNRFGAAHGIRPLIREVSEKGVAQHALCPIHGLTVPHHGSGDRPARFADLEWWLDGASHGRSSRPAPAIVQGGSFALKPNTVEELFQAGLDVLATAEPQNLLDRYVVCKELDERLPAPRSVQAPSPFRIQPMPAGPDNLPAHIAVYGGAGGIHRIDLHGVFRISPRRHSTGTLEGATAWP